MIFFQRHIAYSDIKLLIKFQFFSKITENKKSHCVFIYKSNFSSIINYNFVYFQEQRMRLWIAGDPNMNTIIGTLFFTDDFVNYIDDNGKVRQRKLLNFPIVSHIFFSKLLLVPN
jgi:hypothetical protein